MEPLFCCHRVLCVGDGRGQSSSPGFFREARWSTPAPTATASSQQSM